MKIHPVGAELFHVDKVMDMKLIVSFYNFVNVCKKLMKRPKAVGSFAYWCHVSRFR